jgi:hypothetical protein
MQRNKLIESLAILACMIFLSLLVAGLFGSLNSAPLPQSEQAQAKPQSAPSKPQPEEVKTLPEKTVPGPQNIKEITAIRVFLGWMWVSIAILVYFLVLKIKETDRLYFSRYFTPDKK